MKTLGTSFSKVIVNNYGDRGFSPSREVSLNRPDTCFLPSNKPVNVLRFFHLASVKHRIPEPLRLSSSLSPDPQVNLGNEEEPHIQESNQSNTVHVKIQLQKECCFGQHFFVVGDHPTFGQWDPTKAIPLNWSDGHFWTAELDMSIGKVIQFKFILKGVDGEILWQPGPDRVLQTWETTNTIMVYEDWENAECQKVLEEESLTKGDEEPIIGSELLVSAENMMCPTDEFVPNLNKEPLPSIHEEQTVAKNIAPSEKPLTIVAENINYSREDLVANSSNKVTKVRSTDYVKKSQAVSRSNDYVKKSQAVSNKTLAIKDINVINGRTQAGNNVINEDIEQNLITNYEVPVLVPGLTPLPEVEAEEASRGEPEKCITVNASDGINEAKSNSSSKLDKKQETDDAAHQEEISEMLTDNEAKLKNEVKTKHQFATEAKQPDSEPLEGSVFQSDMQWGRRTLHKLFNYFWSAVTLNKQNR
ncbi:uncharacterized protein LOC110807731 isoform X2 [Carica papaya]|uniref:uncharacterized protein LOC110807731 isoform X2 n=1 Tax=Carica papaya TaxID=3649 RepID=UPI000B8CE570|nr:uncharacterized protein LOC110807731 isoform X2 [Carica papaya]